MRRRNWRRQVGGGDEEIDRGQRRGMNAVEGKGELNTRSARKEGNVDDDLSLDRPDP